ncbi:hypothetical protein BGZ82_011450 [Podila clonocystis]|nr:hypothetical protein BGZ82_011450 [Podila clonocystis]
MILKRPRALSIDTSKDGLICTRTKNDSSAPEETPTPPSCRLEKIYEEKLEILGVIGYENWFDDHANPFYRQNIQNTPIPATMTMTTTTTTTTVNTKNDSALAAGVETASRGNPPFEVEESEPEAVEMDNTGTMSNDVLVFPLASTKTTAVNKCTKIEEEDEKEEEFTGFETLSDTSSCCSAFGLGISFDQDDGEDDHHSHHSHHDPSDSDSGDNDEERDVFHSEHSSDTRSLWNKTFRPVTPSSQASKSSIEPSSTASSHAFSTLTKALNLHRQQILTRRLSNRNRIMDRGHLLPDTTYLGGTPTMLSPPLPLAPCQAGIPFASCGSKVRALSPYPRPFTQT